MRLSKDIAAFEAEKQRTHDRDVLDMIDTTTADLVATGIAAQALAVGDQSPAFELPDQLGNMVRSTDVMVHGPVVLNFYRGEWCPYCNLELRAHQAKLDRMERLGASFLAISPMLPDNSMALAEKHQLAYPVLSDVGNEVAAAFGLVFTVDSRI